MVLALTTLLLQFSVVQTSVPTGGSNAPSQTALAAAPWQAGAAAVNTPVTSNASSVQPLGIRRLSHVHLLGVAGTSQPSTANGDGSSSSGASSGSWVHAATEGTDSLAGIIAAPAPATPLPPFKAGPNEVRKTSRMWTALTIAQHSAATYDAWSTRRALSAGGRYEADPLIRPFANSPALYGAIQVGPVVLDYLGRRMSRSENKWMHRLWWLPQSAATAGFLFSGSHNLIHSH